MTKRGPSDAPSLRFRETFWGLLNVEVSEISALVLLLLLFILLFFFFGKISGKAWNKKEEPSKDHTPKSKPESVNIPSYSAFYNQGLGSSLFSSFCIQNKLCALRHANRLSVTQLSRICCSLLVNRRDETNALFNGFIWPHTELCLAGLMSCLCCSCTIIITAAPGPALQLTRQWPQRQQVRVDKWAQHRTPTPEDFCLVWSLLDCLLFF